MSNHYLITKEMIEAIRKNSEAKMEDFEGLRWEDCIDALTANPVPDNYLEKLAHSCSLITALASVIAFHANSDYLETKAADQLREAIEKFLTSLGRQEIYGWDKKYEPDQNP